MNGLVKSGAVVAGYVIAVLAASAAVAVRVAHTSGPDSQASAGMYAFGDGLLFLAVFGVVAILPTGLALFFLRPYRVFWIVLSIVALVLAATGLLAAIVYVSASHWAAPHSAWEFWAALSVLRMLPAPVLVMGFILAVFIAPNRTSRWILLIAAGIEGVVAVYAVLQWFLGCCFM
jgi:hypothetical protein